MIELKRNMTNACNICIIVGKFYYWKKPCLSILFIIYKGLELGCYYYVLSFNLAISLQIKCI